MSLTGVRAGCLRGVRDLVVPESGPVHLREVWDGLSRPGPVGDDGARPSGTGRCVSAFRRRGGRLVPEGGHGDVALHRGQTGAGARSTDMGPSAREGDRTPFSSSQKASTISPGPVNAATVSE